MLEFDYYIPPSVPIDATTGDILDFSEVYMFDNNTDKFLCSFTGYGMPKIEYITQRGPYQHGRTALDYRLQPRTVVLQHRRNTCDRYSYWDARGDILNLLRPNYQLTDEFQPGRLRKILPDGSTRDLYVFFDDGLPFSSRPSVWDEFSIEEQVRFIAYDPIFFNPVADDVVWTLAVLNFWVLPWVFPEEFLFGSGIVSETVDVTYAGTWLTYPTIQIVGPVNSPTIENVTTNEKITLNYDIPVGRTVTFDLSYGAKTVTDDLGTNLIGVVTTDSDLATFHIAPHPEATNGLNQLRVTASNLTLGSSAITVFWNTRYIGI